MNLNHLKNEEIIANQRILIPFNKEEKQKVKDWNEMAKVSSNQTISQPLANLPAAKNEINSVRDLGKKHGLNIEAVDVHDYTETEFKKRFFEIYTKYWHIVTHGYGGTNELDVVIQPFLAMQEIYSDNKKIIPLRMACLLTKK